MEQGYKEYLSEINGVLIDKKIPDLKKLMSNLKAVSQMDSVFNSSLFLLDHRTQEFLYLSPNNKEIQGYSAEEVSEMGPLKYLELMHPTDSKIITEIIYPEGMKAVRKIPLVFLKKMKVSFTHRLIQKDGSYIKLKKQFSTLLFDENKNSLVIFGTNSIYESDSEDIVSEISYQGPFNKYIVLQKKTYPVDSEYNTLLTPKELEIVKLVSEGLSSKEIASKTGKSVETVNTQRKNIINKTNTQSMTDVVVLAIKNKWI